MYKDLIKARARHARYRIKKRIAKYGFDPGDMRGRHGNHARGVNHHRWRGGNPIPDRTKRLANAKSSAMRHPERVKARQQVHYAVKIGQLPHPKTQPCFDCGSPATSYDHFKGHAFPLDVQAVCFTCHGRRSRERGEHRRKNKVQPIPDDLMIREFPKGEQ